MLNSDDDLNRKWNLLGASDDDDDDDNHLLCNVKQKVSNFSSILFAWFPQLPSLLPFPFFKKIDKMRSNSKKTLFQRKIKLTSTFDSYPWCSLWSYCLTLFAEITWTTLTFWGWQKNVTTFMSTAICWAWNLSCLQQKLTALSSLHRKYYYCEPTWLKALSRSESLQMSCYRAEITGLVQKWF